MSIPSPVGEWVSEVKQSKALFSAEIIRVVRGQRLTWSRLLSLGHFQGVLTWTLRSRPVDGKKAAVTDNTVANGLQLATLSVNNMVLNQPGAIIHLPSNHCGTRHGAWLLTWTSERDVVICLPPKDNVLVSKARVLQEHFQHCYRNQQFKFNTCSSIFLSWMRRIK